MTSFTSFRQGDVHNINVRKVRTIVAVDFVAVRNSFMKDDVLVHAVQRSILPINGRMMNELTALKLIAVE